MNHKYVAYNDQYRLLSTFYDILSDMTTTGNILVAIFFLFKF